MLVDLASCVFSRVCRVPYTDYVYAEVCFFFIKEHSTHPLKVDERKRSWMLVRLFTKVQITLFHQL